MKKNEFEIGPEAKAIKLMKNKLVIQPINVAPRTRAVILNDKAKQEFGIKDFNGNHPYLARVVAKGADALNVEVNDIIAISETVIAAASRGAVSEIMLDGEAYAVIHESDVVGIMNFYRDKIKDGKIDKE